MRGGGWTGSRSWLRGAAALVVAGLGMASVGEAAAPAGQWWNAGYRYRQKLNVTAGATNVPSQYSVRVQLDHAALVAGAQSLASGGDVRVAWWNGTGWVELDRLLDDQSSWNTATTRLWFRTQALIGAGTTDDNYYLYFGNATAGAPPANWANVFLFYDDFNDGVLDGARWICTDPTTASPPAACTESAVAPGTVSLQDDSALYAAAGYAFGVDTRWESRLRTATHLPAAGAFFNYFNASDLVNLANPYQTDWVSMWSSQFQHEAEGSDNGAASSVAVPVVTANSFHVYSFNREGLTALRFFQDATQLRLLAVAANIPTANLRAVVWNDGGAADGIVLDWVRVRRYVSPEPTAVAGGPELAPPTLFGGPTCVVTTAIGTANDLGYDVAVQPDGRVVVGGYFTNLADRDMAVLRYNADLRLDSSFDGDGLAVMDIWGHDHAESVVLQPDGRIVLGGVANQNGLMGCCDEFGSARFNSDGSADTVGYGAPNGHVATNVAGSWDLGRAVAVQPDGKILLAGYVDDGGGNWNIGLVRYNANGSLDTLGFNPAGTFGIAPNSPGRVVTSVQAGSDYGNALVLQPDGKILVGGATWNGTDWDWVVLRYNTNGSLDDGGPSDSTPADSFNPSGLFGDAPNLAGMVVTDLRGSDDWGNAIALQPDGKIVMGAKSANAGDIDFAVARFNADGSLDGSFGTGGMAFTPIGPGSDDGETLALQPDGKIVLGGYTWNGTDSDFAVVRYNADGTVDGTFGSGGKVVTPVGTGADTAHGIAIQPDGRILLVGDSHNGANLDVALARYMPNGTIDGTCGVNYRSIGTALDYGSGQAPALGGGTSVSVTQGSALVAGSVGVAWLTANRGRGDRIQIGGVDYTVVGVDTESQLRLTVPYMGSTAAAVPYTISRQFRGGGVAGQALVDWEDCVDGPPGTACLYFPVASSNLVNDDRAEVGVAYADSVFGLTADFRIEGATTDASHTIRLTADGANRHNGAVGAGVIVDAQLGPNELIVRSANVTVEWLELRGLRGGDAQGLVRVLDSGATNVLVQNLLLHDFYDPTTLPSVINQSGLRLSGTAGKSVTVRNVMVWDGDHVGLSADEAGDAMTIENCSIDDMRDAGGSPRRGVFADQTLNVIVRNTIATRSGTDFQPGSGSFAASSTNNVSSDGTGPGGNPIVATAASLFVNPGVDLHLTGGAAAIDSGVDLAPAFYNDVDGGLRPSGLQWDRGADESGATTAVELQSFAARPGDASVRLVWRTASELANLGFHLYRSLSERGPWARLTTSLIPGLGSSAVGRDYSYLDSGLRNGTRYYYRLEDVDASSRTTSHGPVSAVPLAGLPGAEPGAEPTSGGAHQGSDGSCPDWVVTAYGSLAGAPSSSVLRCTRHGDPEAVSLAVVGRDARSATLELRTGGFYALHDESGRVRVFVPGFDFPPDAEAAALPFRRALVDAIVGRRVQLGGVRALEPVAFQGLVPAALGQPEMQLAPDGTVRARRRAPRVASSARAPIDLARLMPSVFQGESKSAVVEISPLRYDARRGIVLARRVRLRLLFTGREVGESGRGRLGRRPGPPAPVTGEVLARLHTTSPGLYAVTFEQVLPGRRRGLAASELRLERRGRAVPFHLEPVADRFGPGGVLYFHSDAAAASTDFSSELAWELVHARDGLLMALASAALAGEPVTSAPLATVSFEVNRFYQPGLLEAEDPWLWEAVASGASRAVSLTLAAVASGSPEPAQLEVWLQGASASGREVDHHVSVALNGLLLGEAQFAGKRPHRMSLPVAAGVLREGENELQLTNVADTGVSSLVFLDRLAVSYPHAPVPGSSGTFEGSWSESGTVGLSGFLGGTPVVVDVSEPAPRWLTGYESWGDGVRFRAEAGRRYWIGSGAALHRPRVVLPQPSELKSATNQADHLVIAPRAFLAAAEPLLERRRDQGLVARGVAFEEIVDAFGHGQPSADAIHSFLAHAYHSWARPSPRYVVLLGDASYDPRNFTGRSLPSPLPALWAKTSYLWTASDPLLAAVNGDDELPDLAIGRIPATTLEQAQMLVAKLLAWEDSGQGLAGAATLVADNPDLGGDFEANALEIAEGYLAGRSEVLRLRELGGETRARIQAALDGGLAYLAYVGHGGAAVWASENVWNSWDAAGLRTQSRQPLLVTINCLNGYFVAPSYDSLSESLLKAEGRGAIAAFSPSGLSLDAPAHQYHRALMGELVSGRHERLGDALLAAQQGYAQTGLMPELISVYHLLGDPATELR